MTSKRDGLLLSLAVFLFLLPGSILWAQDTKTEDKAIRATPEPTAAEQLRTLCREPEPAPVMEPAGVFTCYAYCPCSKCCGGWSGQNLTASGTAPEAGRTIAADWSILPAGSVIYIDGLGEFVVEDTGSGIEGYKLDVFSENHESALQFGIQEKEVYIIETVSHSRNLGERKRPDRAGESAYQVGLPGQHWKRGDDRQAQTRPRTLRGV